jgi:uncharacterized protein
VAILLELLLTMALAVAPAAAQNIDPQDVDAGLRNEIEQMNAIDNHSHPPAVVAPGQTDDEFDALPCGPLQPTQPGLMTRPDNPLFAYAWQLFWNYAPSNPTAPTPSDIEKVTAIKQRIRQEKSDDYSAWVLDRLRIETELANRVAMGPGLAAPRFRWVPFEDALLFPLNNDALARETPDRKFFFGRENMLLVRYQKELGLTALPATLGDYTARVVTAILQKQKQDGAVAVKFEAAYLRSLDFEPAGRQEATATYAKYVRGGTPDQAAYRELQDYLFRYIAAEAGRLQLPVHIHTGIGCGGYFNLAGSNPLLLESVLNDATLRKTNFVLLHGGSGPFTAEASALLMKPNVYVDMSEQTWLLSPRRLSQVLRDWLEANPEKVLFGTDLYPGAGAYDWEEIGWLTTQTARQALGAALTGMMRDGEITRTKALEMARMVLRGNALKLYGWPDSENQQDPH